MRHFNVGSLNDWEPIATGELRHLEVPGGYRKVRFEVLCDSHVCVQAVAEDERYWLIGCGEGMFTVEFSTSAPVGIAFVGDPAAQVYWRTRTATQLLPETDDPSYTTIEPRTAGPSDEVRRLMHIMQINQRQREQMLLDQIADLTSRGQVIEDEPPAPPPAPAKPEEPASE